MADETNKNGFVLFWKGIFSQWHPISFVEGDLQGGTTLYPTAEHWMMANKARLFGDVKTLNEIMSTDSPRDAKKLGRKVRGFNPDVWTEKCFGIVVQGNYLKFSQNEAARDHLLKTEGRILVEASPYDQIWGIGMGQEDARATNPALWEGKNLLGQALMVVRDMV